MDKARVRLRAGLAILIAGVALLPLLVMLPSGSTRVALCTAIALAVALSWRWRLLPAAVPTHVRPSRRS